MTDVTIPEADLHTIPAEREIVSFRLVLDTAGRFVCFKVLTAGGRQEALLLADPILLHLRDSIAERLRTREKGTRLAGDHAFFRRQPVPDAADWNPANAHVGVPRGAQVVTYPDLCVIAFPLDEAGTHTAYRLRPLHAAYLMHAINDAQENSGLGERAQEVAPAAPGTTTLH